MYFVYITELPYYPCVLVSLHLETAFNGGIAPNFPSSLFTIVKLKWSWGVFTLLLILLVGDMNLIQGRIVFKLC